MPVFDKYHESTQLTLLAKQFASIVEVRGEVTFKAELDDDFLGGSSWIVDEQMLKPISESGFKIQLLELLDHLIEYRGAYNQHPRKGGLVRFENGTITIEWQRS